MLPHFLSLSITKVILRTKSVLLWKNMYTKSGSYQRMASLLLKLLPCNFEIELATPFDEKMTILFNPMQSGFFANRIIAGCHEQRSWQRKKRTSVTRKVHLTFWALVLVGIRKQFYYFSQLEWFAMICTIWPCSLTSDKGTRYWSETIDLKKLLRRTSCIPVTHMIYFIWPW